MIEQTTIFDFINEKYRITKKIRLIELFAGIGAQAKALERLGVDFEKYRVVEFDKYAIASYNAIHGTNFPALDVTKITGKDLGIVETDKYEYILFYSFPCTDISLAGRCAGMEKGSGTRSSLLWEVERLLNEVDILPQCLIMENVPQIHSKKNLESFNTWLSFLEQKGYKNYWQDLNAKDYGIPQNRNRTFVVSVFDGKYDFPKKIPLTKKLKDMLDDDVDEKYYLSDKMINYISQNGTKNFKNPDCKINLDVARPLTTDQNKRAGTTNYICNNVPNNYDLSKPLNKCLRENDLSKIENSDYSNNNPTCLNSKGGRKGVDGLQLSRKDRIYDSESVAATIATSEFYNPAYLVDESYLKIKNATIQEYLLATVQKDMALTINCKGDGDTGVVVRKYGIFDKDGQTHQAGSVYDTNGIAPTLDTMQGGYRQPCIEISNYNNALKETLDKNGMGNLEDGDFIDGYNGKVKKDIANTITTRLDILGVVVKEKRHYNKHLDETLEKEEQKLGSEYSYIDAYNRKIRGNIAGSITTKISANNDCFIGKKQNNLSIRKLTPKECFRLMGFDDHDYEKVKAVPISDAQLYKQAGNSIVVDVLMAIFKEML